jgi:hypothetical protein
VPFHYDKTTNESQFLATNFPKNFNWLGKYYDETFLALNCALQYGYLKNYGEYSRLSDTITIPTFRLDIFRKLLRFATRPRRRGPLVPPPPPHLVALRRLVAVLQAKTRRKSVVVPAGKRGWLLAQCRLVTRGVTAATLNSLEF